MLQRSDATVAPQEMAVRAMRQTGESRAGTPDAAQCRVVAS